MTEKASFLLCCWRHNATITTQDLLAELTKVNECNQILEWIEFSQSMRCQIKKGHLARLDLPFTTSAEMKPECNHLREKVEAFREDKVVKCRWKPGHFDVGYDAVISKPAEENGLMNWRLCLQFHQQCEVWNRKY